MHGEISIQQVLAEIRDTSKEGHTFLLRWVRSRESRNGKKGSIKTVPHCQYGKKGGSRSISSRAKAKSLHIEKGTLPVYDAESGAYLTPLISHIIQFNQLKVIH